MQIAWDEKEQILELRAENESEARQLETAMRGLDNPDDMRETVALKVWNWGPPIRPGLPVKFKRV